jgi:hypothetical protein
LIFVSFSLRKREIKRDFLTVIASEAWRSHDTSHPEIATAFYEWPRNDTERNAGEFKRGAIPFKSKGESKRGEATLKKESPPP